MSVSQTYTLAHTAQCKLRLAADRPDRDLRFVLGHAFTFDKLMLKIVEIEGGQASALEHKHENHLPQEPTKTGHVSVKGDDDRDRPSDDLPTEAHSVAEDKNLKTPKTAADAQRPPPPAARFDEDSSGSDEYVFDDYTEDADDDDDASLGLTRFASASAQPPPPPPNLDPNSDSSSDDEGEREPLSPVPSDAVLATITEEEGDEELAELYDTVRNCGCQSRVEEKAPPISSIWEVPPSSAEKGTQQGTHRTAVVRIKA